MSEPRDPLPAWEPIDPLVRPARDPGLRGFDFALVLFLAGGVLMVVALALLAPATPDPADRARQLCAPAAVHAWSYERGEGTLSVTCEGGRLAWE